MQKILRDLHMAVENAYAPLRGKTIRLTWTDGPTKGETHEHAFHQDSTVEWHTVGMDAAAASETQRPRFADFAIGAEACMFSYLSRSGYTLTAVLRFQDESVVGFASNDKTWFPVKGTFEVMGSSLHRTEALHSSPQATSSLRATS
ncbi:MAG TPA: hypothetical protein VGI57_15615 [Usitatibacter sp.]|jgi:hypothetical protein